MGKNMGLFMEYIRIIFYVLLIISGIVYWFYHNTEGSDCVKIARNIKKFQEEAEKNKSKKL